MFEKCLAIAYPTRKRYKANYFRRAWILSRSNWCPVTKIQTKQLYSTMRVDDRWNGHTASCEIREREAVSYVDHGASLDDDGMLIAKEAFVFMIVGINSSWKLLVGYFLTDSLCGMRKKNLMDQCLKLMHECGGDNWVDHIWWCLNKCVDGQVTELHNW